MIKVLALAVELLLVSVAGLIILAVYLTLR
jgi:hypothetical protein